MSNWWSKLIGWVSPSEQNGPPLSLPGEPNVFECRACGKVFDASGQMAICPECDSPDVDHVD